MNVVTGARVPATQLLAYALTALPLAMAALPIYIHFAGAFKMSLNPKITDWAGQRVWIIGASTGIGAALAQALHLRQARVALSARRTEKLDEMVQRFGVTRVLALPLDITEISSIEAAEEKLVAAWGGYDLAIFMAGEYAPMRAWQIDLDAAQRMVAVNWGGFLNGLSRVIPRLLQQKAGGIALVSSVAGYRGLPMSLIYGPTKAALISAEAAAAEIIKGFEKGRFEIHFPKRFTRLMKMLRHIPYRWYFPIIRKVTKL